MAFSVHLLVLADPQWLHNDQVLCSEREVGHHKQRIALTAWIPAPGTLPPLAQVTGSFRKGQGRKPRAGGGKQESTRQGEGGGQVGSLQARESSQGV